jgi:hypothetical protein
MNKAPPCYFAILELNKLLETLKLGTNKYKA